MASPERSAGTARPDSNFVERTLEQKDLAELGAAIAAAERLLGATDPGTAADATALSRTIAALELEIAEDDSADRTGKADHEQQLQRLRARFERRTETFGRIEAAVGRLREFTSPPAILAAAPRELCTDSEFERAVLSTVERGVMTASAVDVEGSAAQGAALLAELEARPLRLEHPLLEAEALRRRRATVVHDVALQPRVDPGLSAAMGWNSYVVAPVFVDGRVFAVLHAGRRDDRLDAVDRDALWRFAVGLAWAFESASLRRGLRHEREQMRRFLDRLNARLGELSDSAIQLAPSELGAAPDPARGRSAASAFDGLLTRREIEVMDLMADGLSNRQIADRLVIAPGTVKFHVNGILRKLRAANRAEAVSRYVLRATGTSPT